MAKTVTIDGVDYYRETFSYRGKRFSVTALHKKDLYAKVALKKAALERGDIILTGNTTVKTWAGEWLETYKKPTVHVNTYAKYKTIVENHITPFIGDESIADIKPINLQKLLNGHAGKSRSNTEKILFTLRQMFDQAEAEELIQRSPAKRLKLPDTVEGSRRSLTDEERAAVVRAAQHHRAGTWAMLMLCAGLRKGETIPLLWSDIDLKKETISINKAVAFVKNRPVEKDAKSDAGNRIVGISNELFPFLERACAERRGLYVFSPEQSTGMLTRTNIMRMWGSFTRAVDIEMGCKLYRNQIVESKLDKNFTPHALRHTFITDLCKKGANPKEVQIVAGHAKISTTLDIYTHLSAGEAATNIVNIQDGKSVSECVSKETETL